MLSFCLMIILFVLSGVLIGLYVLITLSMALSGFGNIVVCCARCMPFARKDRQTSSLCIGGNMIVT